ncbi:hypothetical protein BU15DRAFT_85032 [Melanogaster broomeanus]|nr:hypothetical protein BU15DRAFT_85032 [Melanogaster broomeanus]
MAERATRPATQLTQSVYQQLFHSGLSLSKLRDAVSQGRLIQSSDGAIGVPGRSLAWKLFLLRDEPLEPSPNEVPNVPIELLRSSRKQFSELLFEKMRAPDGSYDESFVVPGLTITRRGGQACDEFGDKQSIEFPDMGYFRNEEVQQQLSNVLFLYSVMHPDIGYRQGMHELLAPLFYAIDFDSIAESPESSGLDPLFLELCSRSWVAADSWAMFSAMMRGISHWYEWREPDPLPSSSHGPMNLKPYTSPIIQTCKIIQGTLLKSVDPVLHDAMHSAGLEPQLYGLRWLRLMFTREFPMNEAMVLWDGLFASSSPIPNVMQWICVAMLVRIRTKLIPSDYSGILMHLLRYPPCPTPEEGAPHHILLLIRQATALELFHTPSAGASLTIENRNLLNIPIEVPDPPPVIRRKARPIERAHQASLSDHVSGSAPVQPGLPELIARGLLDRGESLGINKTVMNAVSELKRNLPDLASTLVRSPSFASSSFSAYPLLDERTPPAERYTWDHRTSTQNKHLGEAVTWILDILDREEDEDGPQESYQVQKKQALSSLLYVRDVLSGQVAEVDERRLWGEDGFKRRWEVRENAGISPSSFSRDYRRFAPNTPVSSSANGPLRSFMASTAGHTPRATYPTASHGRTQSSGTLFSSRPTVPQRAPVRTSVNNPFERVSDGGKVSQSAVAGEITISGDQSPNVRSEVQQDPLGVLK